ncbi:hypothetical protein CC85DRAFT_303217 [Cutaneotrichosporon oleaginosum]|uniref:Uncharacterized protein n=1 Tax=Cutaneotrichosporon oleaginosum TaxID=879819 RepID=A0A0J0XK23_9TREE|nr:uncharacterized protein CC85DRAFT_303217 [Cutaneotrichosporon oleaginosum]KLT41417.1 hypothetical protein CC85DRAFT_303217 [Cutaneotrichosporon oleaginosum]TXT12180.1 hypothetical protein COLE_02590 [Cutaneotrichosporon oleaginosum]
MPDGVVWDARVEAFIQAPVDATSAALVNPTRGATSEAAGAAAGYDFGNRDSQFHRSGTEMPARSSDTTQGATYIRRSLPTGPRPLPFPPRSLPFPPRRPPTQQRYSAGVPPGSNAAQDAPPPFSAQPHSFGPTTPPRRPAGVTSSPTAVQVPLSMRQPQPQSSFAWRVPEAPVAASAWQSSRSVWYEAPPPPSANHLPPPAPAVPAVQQDPTPISHGELLALLHEQRQQLAEVHARNEATTMALAMAQKELEYTKDWNEWLKTTNGSLQAQLHAAQVDSAKHFNAAEALTVTLQNTKAELQEMHYKFAGTLQARARCSSLCRQRGYPPCSHPRGPPHSHTEDANNTTTQGEDGQQPNPPGISPLTRKQWKALYKVDVLALRAQLAAKEAKVQTLATALKYANDAGTTFATELATLGARLVKSDKETAALRAKVATLNTSVDKQGGGTCVHEAEWAALRSRANPSPRQNNELNGLHSDADQSAHDAEFQSARGEARIESVHEDDDIPFMRLDDNGNGNAELQG